MSHSFGPLYYMTRILVVAAGLLCSTFAQAAEPVKSALPPFSAGRWPTGDSPNNTARNWLWTASTRPAACSGRPVEAFYADNACKPDVGVPATKRLLEQEHVPVVIGALCTPVTHAIMPVMAAGQGAAGDRDLGRTGFC